jgi:hypothetical protein
MYAIAVPLKREKVGAWKLWMRECAQSRRDEFEAFNERMGLTLHRAWLSEGREGPVAIVVFDGPGAETFLEKLADSQESFDKWFRERVSEYHGMDFSKLETTAKSELCLDWRTRSYAEAHR